MKQVIDFNFPKVPRTGADAQIVKYLMKPTTFNLGTEQANIWTHVITSFQYYVTGLPVNVFMNTLKDRPEVIKMILSNSCVLQIPRLCEQLAENKLLCADFCMAIGLDDSIYLINSLSSYSFAE